MRKYLLIVLIFHVLFLSCSEKKLNFQKDELLGVWSGLLFQTESKYDSILIKPANQPKEALLFKNGKKTVYPLILNGEILKFKGDAGLRFDGILLDDKQIVNAFITNDLWARNLNFKKVNDSWVSKIYKPEIIDTDYKVYLEFYRDTVGNIQANIQSNKENRELHFIISEVLINENDINFNITNDRFKISATYEAIKKNISLNYSNPGGKRTIQLTKLHDDELEGYLPRASTKKYEYKIPKSPDELIQTASLEEVGIDMSLIGLMDQVHSKKFEHIHSIIITKNKKLVFEEYFHGYDREYLHDIRSAFKSIASITMGKAMMKNSELKVTNTILDYYPEYDIKDAQKKKINIHHALTMSSGLQNEDEDKMQSENSDWVKYKLDHPIEHEPGDKYQYSDGGINLLSGVMEVATNQYLPAFVQRELLTPMGISEFQMLTSPVGRGYLAGNFYLRPIDFTKFGLLMLNNGKWNGEQLIAKSWVEESTKPHIKGSNPKNTDYGYLWKLLERKIGDKKVQTIEAWGNGGQFLIIIPELDMTITFTGGNYNLFPEMERPFEILNTYILPAVILEKK